MKFFKKHVQSEDETMTVENEIKDIINGFETKQSEIDDLRSMIASQESKLNDTSTPLDEAMKIKSEQSDNKTKLSFLQQRYDESLLEPAKIKKLIAANDAEQQAKTTELHSRAIEQIKAFQETMEKYHEQTMNNEGVATNLNKALNKYCTDKKALSAKDLFAKFEDMRLFIFYRDKVRGKF